MSYKDSLLKLQNHIIDMKYHLNEMELENLQKIQDIEEQEYIKEGYNCTCGKIHYYSNINSIFEHNKKRKSNK